MLADVGNRGVEGVDVLDFRIEPLVVPSGLERGLL